MVFCSKCGANVNSGANFCDKCGAPLPQQAQANAAQPEPQPAGAPNNNPGTPPPFQRPAGTAGGPGTPPPFQQPGANGGAGAPPPAYGQQQAQPGGFGWQHPGVPDQTDHTAEFDPNDIAQNKGMALLSYLSLLFLIPLLACPNSRYARFHANQGLVLFLAEVILGVASGIVSLILRMAFYFSPVGSVLVGLISFAVAVVILIMVVLGLINAANGKAKELPVIGKIKLVH